MLQNNSTPHMTHIRLKIYLTAVVVLQIKILNKQRYVQFIKYYASLCIKLPNTTQCC